MGRKLVFAGIGRGPQTAQAARAAETRRSSTTNCLRSCSRWTAEGPVSSSLGVHSASPVLGTLAHREPAERRRSGEVCRRAKP